MSRTRLSLFQQAARVLLVAMLAMAVSSCGFQIRGSSTIPPSMQRTYIDAANKHSGFYQKLRRELQMAGVELVDSPADATATFSITTDQTDQRVLAVSARNVPREYEVFYTISYQLVSGQTTLMPSRIQTQTRDYTWDETQVLGKEKEEQLLRDAIIDDLVRVVMIQISAL